MISAEIFNEEFPLARREDLFSRASEDKQGDKVVCYRYMSWELDHVLTHDTWDPSILNDWVYNAADFVKKYIKNFLDNSQKRKYSKIYHLDTPDSEIESMLQDMLLQEFWALPEEIWDLLWSQKLLMSFILDTFPLWEVISAHRGYPTSFSPYMSWSIAGISWYFLKMIWSRFHNRQSVYIEAIIPDNEMIYDDRQKWWEKEVLTTKVKKEWISRVFTSRKQLIQETFGDGYEYCQTWFKRYAETKEYAIKSEENPFPLLRENINYSDIAEHWRFNIDTKLYLPKWFKIIDYS